MGYLQKLTYYLNVFKAWTSHINSKNVVAWADQYPEYDRLVKRTQRMRFDLEKDNG